MRVARNTISKAEVDAYIPRSNLNMTQSRVLITEVTSKPASHSNTIPKILVIMTQNAVIRTRSAAIRSTAREVRAKSALFRANSIAARAKRLSLSLNVQPF
ncbi:hypothetical protein DP113_31265 [Brasilonema octagenarum UFV-E1]|uniref:Uncharacterized protein n=1 Tax=Brasilonema sennae CENA114 TaxID=415709 RepID=A0A856MK57_9CYAN|nr:hypothetical protein DP114_31125 [Brasilonema sennae CENA114]QDL18135.1 hypothetical protein DP113_31265 [Brasilonema octagenarum UFV-E1]